MNPSRTHGLVDILDRVLDKGLVIAGDIKINLANVELLTIQVRLLVCSIDKAEQIGLNWWRNDPRLTMSAPTAPDVNHLWPLMTHSSPSRTARVRSSVGSDPAVSGSVIEKQLRVSPSSSGWSQRFFCASLPNSAMYGTTMSEWSGTANPDS